MADVSERLARVRERIAAAGGDPARVAVVAVTKGVDEARACDAVAAGVTDLGENYAGELSSKAGAVASAGYRPRWHFLGAVQRRKVRDLAAVVDTWQSLDRLAAGEEIAKHAPGAPVFVQVNVTGEPHRPGCRFDDAPELVIGLRRAGLHVRGLMCVAGRERPADDFRRVAELGRRLGLAELSMGMSGDLEAAVREGSTMVRVGTALFGPRPERGDLRRYPHARGGS